MRRVSRAIVLRSTRRDFHVPRISHPPPMGSMPGMGDIPNMPMGTPRTPNPIFPGDATIDPSLASLSQRSGDVLDKDDPAASWEKARKMAETSATQRKQVTEDNRPAPSIIKVPALCSRCVGRDTDLFQMWQKLNQGKRVLVLSGIDGVGKSTLAAAFGEHVRRSGRFSCIQWIDGRNPVPSQLHAFAKEVAGRKESRAMLIIDSVDDIMSVLNLIPITNEFAVVLTTNKPVKIGRNTPTGNNLSEADKVLYEQIYVMNVGPPTEVAACEMLHDAIAGLGSAGVVAPEPGPNGDEPVLPNDVAPFTIRNTNVTLSPVPAEHHPISRLHDNEHDRAEVTRLTRRISCVPLLCHIAGSLIREGGIGPSEVIAMLDRDAPIIDDAMSISQTLTALMNEVIRRIEKDVPNAGSVLRGLSLVNTEDLNPGLVDALYGEQNAGALAIQSAIRYGLAGAQWESDAITLQAMVASWLRANTDDVTTVAAHVAKGMSSLWPKRWRGMGSDRAWSLARHAAALHESVTTRRVPLTDDMAGVFDKAATFMAHIAGRDLQRAGEMWNAVSQHYDRTGKRDADAARVAFDALKIFYRGGDHRARELAERAYQLHVETYGANSKETALVVLYRSKFVDFSEASLKDLEGAAATLRTLLTEQDDVEPLTTEARAMYREALFGTALAIAKTHEALGRTVPDALWAELDGLHEILKTTAAAKQAEEERQQKAKRGNAFDLDA